MINGIDNPTNEQLRQEIPATEALSSQHHITKIDAIVPTRIEIENEPSTTAVSVQTTESRSTESNSMMNLDLSVAQAEIKKVFPNFDTDTTESWNRMQHVIS